MPLACGIAKMPLKEFLLGNLLATSIWVAVFGLLTHFAFEHLHQITTFYDQHRYLIWSLGGLIFAAMLYTVIKHKRQSKK